MRILLYLCMLIVGVALADDKRTVSITPVKHWQQECGACHIAYPAYMLPPESWIKLMQGLDKHFDTDASLTAREMREITDYLLKHAANPKYYDSAPLRITETSRFRNEHDQIETAFVKHRSVKSLANCQACHPGAEQENFDEHKLPSLHR